MEEQESSMGASPSPNRGACRAPGSSSSRGRVIPREQSPDSIPERVTEVLTLTQSSAQTRRVSLVSNEESTMRLHR